MNNYEKSILDKKFNRLIRRNKLAGKKIVIFGASAMSRDIKKVLDEQSLVTDIVVDNDVKKIGTEWLSLTVQEPGSALQPHNQDAVILLYSQNFYSEITAQLEKMGYVINKHIFVLNDERKRSFLFRVSRELQGYRTYKRITKQYPSNTTVFIAPYTGTGDVYLIGLFFAQYIKEKQIREYVFIVVSGACKKVAEMFGIKNIVIVQPHIVDYIIDCNRALRADWPIIVLNDGWSSEPLQWVRGYKGLNFEKVFRYFVFEFNDDKKHELPTLKVSSNEIDALFQKHRLLKGKTVVLSPYSNTLFELPNDFWTEIVEFCKRLGYTVCTNCAGPAEKPIDGTETVFFPLGQAIDFLDAAGYFIGVRSGFCDIISSSSCKKVVLYEKDGFFYKSSSFEYFSLRQMGLSEDALELEYRSDLKEAILEGIYSVL